jgi:hypothetical protein
MMRKPVCRIRKHRWEIVPARDARKCSRCKLELGALDVIREYRAHWWLAEVWHGGKARAADATILGFGWPDRGTFATVDQQLEANERHSGKPMMGPKPKGM